MNFNNDSYGYENLKSGRGIVSKIKSDIAKYA